MRKTLLLLSLLLCVATTSRAEPAMWVVRDADSTIYLLGTVHVLRPEMVWKSEKITSALRESDEVWLELIDSDNEAVASEVMKKHGFDLVRPLSKKLSAKQHAQLMKLAKSYGMPPATLEPMKPWTVALLLTLVQVQKAGYDPKSGVEELLKAQAKKEGKELRGFETMEEQIVFFAELPEAEQIAFLEQTLEYAEEGVALLDGLAKAWSEGDVDAIAKVMVEELKEKSPELYDKLLVQRNVRWTEKIEKILRGSGVQMIAVGAGHLAGPDSVQVQLEKRGIKVERR